MTIRFEDLQLSFLTAHRGGQVDNKGVVEMLDEVLHDAIELILSEYDYLAAPKGNTAIALRMLMAGYESLTAMKSR